MSRRPTHRIGGIAPRPHHELAPLRTVVAVVGAAFVASAIGCGSGGSPPSGSSAAADIAASFPAEVEITGIEVVLSDANYDLAQPRDIAVDRQGRLYIMDRRSRHVVVVGSDGEVEATIGRDGGGPGEFRLLIGMAVRGDNLYVLDNVHGVQVFDSEGAYLSTYTVARIFSELDFSAAGGVIFSNNRVYATGAQVGRVGADGEVLDPVGALVFPDAEPMGMRAVADAVIEGNIPDVLRNHTLPIAAPDGSIWAVSPTEHLLRHYSAGGELLGEATLDVAELPAIEQQYLEDFAGAPIGDLFFFPNYVEDGVASAGGLLLLWSTLEGEPGLITVHDAAGAIIQRLLLPDITDGGGGTMALRMAYDPARRRLYISASGTATVYGFDLPRDVAF